MAINIVEYANTFGQWLIITNQLVSQINNLTSNNFTKSNGTLYITSPGTSLSVSNNALFSGTLQIAGSGSTLSVSGPASFVNTSISGIFTTTGNNILSGNFIGNDRIVFRSVTSQSIGAGFDYIIVNRGESLNPLTPNAVIRWDEANTTSIYSPWQLRDVNSPNNYYSIITSNNKATISNYGITLLNDTIYSTNIALAATANSVNAVNNLVLTNNNYINSVNSYANLAYYTASAAFNKANSANVTAVSAFSQANSANSYANTAIHNTIGAFNQANIANVTAISAFNKANSVVLSLTGNTNQITVNTSTGNILISLSGNIAVPGNVSSNAVLSNSIVSSKYININTQTGTTYTLNANDSGSIITVNNASAIAITIPSGLPIGFRCVVTKLSAGFANLVASGTTLYSRTGNTSISNRYGSASIVSVASNVYILDGNL